MKKVCCQVKEENMSEHHKHHDSGFMNGVVLGILIGAALFFLVGTKRGKKLWELLKDSGLSVLGDIEELFNEFDDDILSDEPLPQVSTTLATQLPVEEKHGGQGMSSSEVGEFGIPLDSFTDPVIPVESLGAMMQTQQVAQQQSSASSGSMPTSAKTVQAHGRRFFHGIPKRKI